MISTNDLNIAKDLFRKGVILAIFSRGGPYQFFAFSKEYVMPAKLQAAIDYKKQSPISDVDLSNWLTGDSTNLTVQIVSVNDWQNPDFKPQTRSIRKHTQRAGLTHLWRVRV